MGSVGLYFYIVRSFNWSTESTGGKKTDLDLISLRL
jgi:hypothetical protein